MERNTSQRSAIRQAFAREKRPLAPAEVLHAARRDSPKLGIATVYRTLNSLVSEGWLTPVDLPGEPTRYELSGLDHHHHFHCTVCGRVFDVPGCAKAVHDLLPKGYTLERHEIVLYGRCDHCSRKGAKSAPTNACPECGSHRH